MMKNNNNNYKPNQGVGGGGAGGPMGQNQPQESKLKLINFDIADIYFPLFVIQVNWDIFPLRNRNFKNYQAQQNAAIKNKQQAASENPKIAQPNSKDQNTGAEKDEEDLAMMYHDMMREQYELQCKVFFILRDQYLLTKISITGTIVYYIKKDDKHFFGIDDSTGVMTCVLWLNDFNNSRGQAGNRQNELRSWLFNQDVKIGDCLSILGGLEYFQDKVQINIHKLRIVKETNEEML